MSSILKILEKISQRQHLSEDEMSFVMHEIMTGKVTPVQISAILFGLRINGETVQEITAAAKVMLKFVNAVKISNQHIVDIVGTGGDGANTFNISTISAFVAAAAGAVVAKHGNRSVSSKSGSADVLEMAGCNINLTSTQVSQCIEKLGIGFLFAPMHHSAMQHVAAIRRELGIRTIFNLLGVLTNPAQVPNLLIGVYDKKWLLPFAEALRNLGKQHALIVHSEEGLDEISVGANTYVVELSHSQITEYTIKPEDFNIAKQDCKQLIVNDAKESLSYFYRVFANERGPCTDIVALNAGAAIYTAGLVDNIAQGIKTAFSVIANGKAKEKFESYIAYTQTFKTD